jgi:hypothetical protein
MNSDLMPSSESPTSTTVNSVQNDQQPAANVNTVAAPSSKTDNSDANESKADTNGHLANRQQPIPPPSEPMQYRAIGLVRGRYQASSEQFTQGSLITTDGVELNAVLLGRIMSLVKNHLDLEKDHLWVVYPRTRQENDSLHLQIVGVWEPENLAKQESHKDDQDADSPELAASENGSAKDAQSTGEPLVPSSEIPDGGFSVRGEVVYQAFDTKSLVVKIKQAPRKPTDKPKYFKLKLLGVLSIKAVGKFWDFNVKREGDGLAIENAEAIADLPKKRKPPMRGGGGGYRGGGGSRKPFPPRKPGEAAPRPVKKRGDDTSPVFKSPESPPNAPMPKPVKRPKPPQQ